MQVREQLLITFRVLFPALYACMYLDYLRPLYDGHKPGLMMSHHLHF